MAIVWQWYNKGRVNSRPSNIKGSTANFSHPIFNYYFVKMVCKECLFTNN